MRNNPAAAVGLAALILMSVVALPVVAGVAAADVGPGDVVAQGSGTPPDHAAVPESRIDVRQTGDPAPGGPPQSAAGYEIAASKHADTLDVEIVLEGDELVALKVGDEVNHEGREVSFDAAAAREALGVSELPERVFGVHETEGRWSNELVVDDGTARVDVPHFSTNTIRFTSTYSIDANPAESGAQFSYTGDSDISDVSINLTGVTNTEWNNQSFAGVTDGQAVSVNIDGNADPLGDSPTGEPQITITGDSSAVGVYVDDNDNLEYVTSDGDIYDTGVIAEGAGPVSDFDGDGDAEIIYRAENDGSGYPLKHIDKSGNTVDLGVYASDIGGVGDPDNDGEQEVAYLSSSGDLEVVDSSGSVTSVLDANSPVDGVGGVGDMDGDGVDEIAYLSDTTPYYVTIDGSETSLYNGHDAYDMGPVTDWDGDGSGEVGYRNKDSEIVFVDDATSTDVVSGVVASSLGETVGDLDGDGRDEVITSPGSTAVHVDPTGEAVEFGGDTYRVGGIGPFIKTVDPAVDVDGDGSPEISHSGELNGEKTAELDTLTTADDSWDVSVGGGTVDISTSIKERTVTKDPVVELNTSGGNQTVTHTGTLENGTTVDVSDQVDESLMSGDATISVSVSESVNSPVGGVGLDLSYSSDESRSVEYVGESFAESYSTTKTYENDVEDAQIRIPFASDYVTEVSNLTVMYEYSDGTEEVIESPSRSWNPSENEVLVELGDVSEGTSISVSAEARKLRVTEGEFTVTNPSDPAGPVDTRIRLDSTGPNGTVEFESGSLRQTDEFGRLAFVSSTSWTDPSTHVYLEPGTQRTVIEDAPTDGSATVSTGPIGARAIEGDATVAVIDAEEPRVRIEPGPTDGDVVELTYFDALEDETYELVRVSDEVLVDTAEANSPVTLRTSDTSGVYSIVLSDGGGGIAIGTSSGSDSGATGPIPEWLLLVLAVAASIGGLAFVASRVELGSVGGRASDEDGIGLRVPVTLAVGALAVITVAIEVATPFSLVWTVVDATVGDVTLAFGPELGGTLVAITVILGLVGVQARTETEIPRAALVAAAALVVLWLAEVLTPTSILGPLASTFVPLLTALGVVIGLLVLDERVGLPFGDVVTVLGSVLAVVVLFETLDPGSVTEPLSAGLDEVGAAIWILAIGSVLVLGYLWLRSRRPEIRVLGGGST